MFFRLKALNWWLLIFIVSWTIYFGLIWSSAILPKSDGWYAAYIPHWGDGVAHLSYMSAFANRDQFPLHHPLFYLHPFTYSFGADMIGGLIAKTGIPIWFIYNWWGFVLVMSGLILLWRLIYLITKSNPVTFIALHLFLFSGGLGFKYLILDQLNPESAVSPSFFFNTLTQRDKTDIAWLNVIVGELIPQRAMLLALPVAAFILIIWYQRFINHQKVKPLNLFLSGIMFGCMPIIHPHTTMTLAVIIICWVISPFYHAIKRAISLKKLTPLIPLFKDLIIIGLPTLILGLTLTIIFISPSVSHGFFKWYPGWLAKSKHINWLIFWWDNWGIFLPLAVVSTIFFTSNKIKILLLPFWVWFVLTNLFLFQPYDWDNSKILTWVYLFLSLPVSRLMVTAYKNIVYLRPIVFIFITIMCLSGSIDAFRMLDTKTYSLLIVNNDELTIAKQVQNNTAKDSVFLTSTTHRNWVPILTGRQILCGYLGWMWTYGIDANQRVDDITSIYQGGTKAKMLIDKYQINYIVIGPEEKYEFKNLNETYFTTNYPLLTQVGQIKVFIVN